MASPASPFHRTLLHNRTAIVTGGGSGIGYEIARQLCLHGARVVLFGRREAFLRTAAEALASDLAAAGLLNPATTHTTGRDRIDTHTANSSGPGSAARWTEEEKTSGRTGSSSSSSRRTTGGTGRAGVAERIAICAGDVRRPEDVDRLVATATDRWGSAVHVVVNAAAGNFLANAAELSPKGFRTVMEIDTVGTFNVCRAAFPALREAGENGGGSVIINISATLHLPATWYQTHASAAKAAVDSLTRSLALEWGAYGVRVVGIAPGPIANTPGLTKLAPGLSEAAEEFSKEGIPIGRMGRTWDIAMMAVFLASHAASFITGDTLKVDGGHWLFSQAIIDRDMVSELSRGVEKSSRSMGPTSGGGSRHAASSSEAHGEATEEEGRLFRSKL